VRTSLGGTGRPARTGVTAAAVTLTLTVAAVVTQAPWAQAAPGVSRAAAGVITTVAGGVGGPAKATTVGVNLPCGVAFDASTGTMYASSQDTVHAVKPQTDRLTPVAGNGSLGPQGDGGPATGAALTDQCGVALDAAGNLLIAETLGERVRVVAAGTGTFYGRPMTAGHIYTVAGTGAPGFSGDGGPATAAKLSDPNDVAVDGAGNLVIADLVNNRIRVVAETSGTFYGQSMTAGDIYTVAGDNNVGPLGNGGPATSAALDHPEAVTVDGAGNLVIADTDSNEIRVVATTSGTFYGQPMTAGDIYLVAGTGVIGFSGDGGAATAAELSTPRGIAVDASGNLVIADTFNYRIRVVATSSGTFYGQSMTAGDIYTIAGNGTPGFSGDGGPATAAQVELPQNLALDGAGLLIADWGNNRVRYLAESNGTRYGQAMTAGDIYTVAGSGAAVFSGDGGPATAAELDQPGGVTADSAGNTVISDTQNNRIRVAATSSGTFYGKAMTAGDIYTIAGTGSFGYHENGGPAIDAEFKLPRGIAADGSGNLVLTDTDNSRIRVIAEHTGTFFGHAMKPGDIYSIAGSGRRGYSGDGGPGTAAMINEPDAVAIDAAGNALFADTSNERVRVVAAKDGTFYGQSMTAGDIYTIAGDGSEGSSGDGGAATKASMSFPDGVTLDSSGNVLISDEGNNRVRVVAATTGTFYGRSMTAGDIYTIAGTGGNGFSGDGGPATGAKLSAPAGLATDSAGNVLIADMGNSRVRVVAATSGSFYGQSMTAGDIYTIAGTSGNGFSGDGGPGTAAEISNPAAVALTPAGNVLITDVGSNRIREVTG
jgi:hypothetical protein